MVLPQTRRPAISTHEEATGRCALVFRHPALPFTQFTVAPDGYLLASDILANSHSDLMIMGTFPVAGKLLDPARTASNLPTIHGSASAISSAGNPAAPTGATMNCRPPTMYVIGIPVAIAGSVIS